MIIDVKLWDSLVGSLYWDDNNRVAIFQYDPSFVRKGLDIAPILMPLKEGIQYRFPDMDYKTFKGLPPMIADSLPDDFGNHIMNAWLSKQGKTIDSLYPTERLGYVGKRGMGALEYEPVLDGKEVNNNDIDLNELVGIAHEVVYSKEKLNYDDINEKSLSKILRIGTSAGGARAKAILAYDEINNIYKPGDITHGANHTYWLIKLDGATNKILGDPEGYGRIEYAYYNMAKDASINMSKSKLIKDGDRAHFITKRFDRFNGDKLHMQTLSGIAGMDYRKPNLYSYEQVFSVLRQLQLPHKDIIQQFRRMVFNVVARNQDDHVKNISFIMDRTENWSLSPAYDVSYCYNPSGDWTSHHQLSINGKRDGFVLDDLLKIGRENNISKRTEIIDQVIESVSRWEHFAKQANVLPRYVKEIATNHRLFSDKKTQSLKKKRKKGFSL
jgi:serine/threonine-protein kinase HipA